MFPLITLTTQHDELKEYECNTGNSGEEMNFDLNEIQDFRGVIFLFYHHSFTLFYFTHYFSPVKILPLNLFLPTHQPKRLRLWGVKKNLMVLTGFNRRK